MGEQTGVRSPYGTALGRLLCASWSTGGPALWECAVAILGVWGSSTVGVTSTIVGDSEGEG